MNCEDFSKLLPDALGDELDLQTRMSFEGHLHTCATCREEYESLCGTVAALRAVPDEPNIQVLRQGDVLTIQYQAQTAESPRDHAAGPASSVLGKRRQPLWQLAASVILAFLVGYAVRGGGGEGLPSEPVPFDGAPQVSASAQAGLSFQRELVQTHLRKPGSSGLAKCFVALGRHHG